MHPACPNQKQNHLQNSLLRQTQFWVRKTFSKPASLKRASLASKQQRHTKQNQKSETQKQNQNKTKNGHTRMTGNQFIGGFMQVMATLCHHILVWPNINKKLKKEKGGKQTHTRPYTQVREATQHHAETRDPPARIPEITWRKPNGIT